MSSYHLVETLKEKGQCVYCHGVGKLYVYQDEKEHQVRVCGSCKGIAEGKEK